MIRTDGRRADELREVRLTPGAQAFAEGSVIIETGATRVLCAVSVEEQVPRFLRGSGQGWITAEYGMLPRSTHARSPRESRAGGPRGRTQEIQRLIGRSLRAAVDLPGLGERTLTVDCDVLQADGGTRTASVTGAYVALYQAVQTLLRQKKLTVSPINDPVAAISVGLVDGRVLLDMCYEEDSRAQADFNVVMTGDGHFVEVQGTAEAGSFSKTELDQVLAVAQVGIQRLFDVQNKAIAHM